MTSETSEWISSYDDAAEYPAGTLCLTVPAGEAGPEERYVFADGVSVDGALGLAADLCAEEGRRATLWRVDSDDQSTRLYEVTAGGDWRAVGA